MHTRLFLAALIVLAAMIVMMSAPVGAQGGSLRLAPTPTLPPAPNDDLTTITREAVTGMRDLIAALDFPDHLRQQNAVLLPGDFDVSAYFSVLDHLSMEEGYALDYVYWFEFMGGRPVLYARSVDGEPYAAFADFQAAYGEDWGDWPNYLDHIVVDDTAAGYMQLAVLNVMGGQFYLFWHASYNDNQIVYDSDTREAILSFPGDFGQPFSPEVQEAARALELTPAVELSEDEARVQLVTFTKWGGFYRWTLTIGRAFPHTMSSQSEQLVAYDCGVAF